MNKLKSNRIDWMITLAPFILIMALVLFSTLNDASFFTLNGAISA